MEKNYLLFIIDSLNNSHVKESPVELMPFFQKLKGEGICCENMFSQAPYTEAAVMNIYCGQDVLQNGGHLFRFKDAPTTLFEEMKKAGYTTYFNSYQPQCHPSSLRRGVDYLYYNVGYDQGALWAYRFEHYARQYEAGELNGEDYEVIRELLEDNFAAWFRFLDDYETQQACVEMIFGNDPDYDPRRVRQLVTKEHERYLAGQDDYIREILTEGTAHSFFKIPAYFQREKQRDRTAPGKIREELSPLFQRIRAMDIRLNLQNGKGWKRDITRGVGRFFTHPGKTGMEALRSSGQRIANALFDWDLRRRIDRDCDRFKNAPSGRVHIDHYLQWAKRHRDGGPHFACVHIDDIHNPEEFFTYDTADMDLIRQEKAEAEAVLDAIPKIYYGSLTHDLSLRYADGLVKYLYERMEEEDFLENTCIAICADHGFSFSGNPYRETFVNNLYLENFNIPCLFLGTGLEPGEIKGLRTSKDIPATICQLATGAVPAGFSGHSLTEDFTYDRVHIEYCGGGCPDLSRRELKLAAFDESYFAGTLCRLDDTLDDTRLTEVYDLAADPRQHHNLCGGEYDREKVAALLAEIEKQREAIRATNTRSSTVSEQ